jgi:hypothetical protein
LGINVFSTPSDVVRYSRAFYDWVRVGELAFKAAQDAGYPRQGSAADVRGRALEVFPHASDVFLRGCLPPTHIRRRLGTRRSWRSDTLAAHGVTVEALCRNRAGRVTLDSIDAALAALTGLLALEGSSRTLGVPGGLLVVPTAREGPFERCHG